MKLIISVVNPYHFLYTIDLATEQIDTIPIRSEFIDPSVKERVECRPFGLAYYNDYLFVSNNKRIHRFDSDLQYVDTIIDNLPDNSHHIAVKDNTLYVTSPWVNSIITIDLKTKEQKFFSVIDDRWEVSLVPSRDNDIHHVNALLWKDNSLYVNFHNRGHLSQIVEYQDWQRIKKINTGYGTHDLVLVDDEFFTLDTYGKKALISNKGLCIPIPQAMFLRGLVVTEDYFIVGNSYWCSNRTAATKKSSELVLIDRATYSIKKVNLLDSGEINGIICKKIK